MFVRRLREVRDQLGRLTKTLDPAVMTGADAAAAVAVCGEIERLAAGARTLLSPRVEATRAWTGQGDRSAAHWLAKKAGTSVGEAAAMISTSKKLDGLAATRAAVRKGALSPKQAELVAQGAAADASAEGALLELAADASLGELRKESQRTVAAAEPDEVAAHQRVWRSRFFRHRRDPDGSWVGTIRTTPECGALMMAAVNHLRPRIFDRARRCGEWSSSEAYDADTVIELAREHLGLAPLPADWSGPEPDRQDTPTETVRTPGATRNDEPAPGTGLAAVLARFPGATVSPCACDPENNPNPTPTSQGDGEGPPVDVDPPLGTIDGRPGWATETAVDAALNPPDQRESQCSAPQEIARPGRGSKASTIVRVDHTALTRGHSVPGELSEITGIGPIPIAVVQDLLTTSFLAVVRTDVNGEVLTVAHLGRRSRAARIAASQHPPPAATGPPPEAGAGPRGSTALAGNTRRPPFGWNTGGLGAVTKIIVRIRDNPAELGEHRVPLDGGPPAGDAFIEALAAVGVSLAELTHRHRQFSALQRTALEFRDPECIVLGCTATARLEIDHRTDWAATHTTNAADADRRCDHHHLLKTRYGWRLEPGTGKRRLLPPHDRPPP